MQGVPLEIVKRQLGKFQKANPAYASGVAEELGLKPAPYRARLLSGTQGSIQSDAPSALPSARLTFSPQHQFRIRPFNEALSASTGSLSQSRHRRSGRLHFR